MVTVVSLAVLTTALFVSLSPASATVGACDVSAGVEVTDLGTHYLVVGTKGNDLIDCAASDKPVEIRGGQGDDQLGGGAFNDLIAGGQGDDEIVGDGGDDRLDGGQGNDQIDAGAGIDTCLGGRGFETLTGCEMADPGQEP
jgi:Ca2+-binding RTX toxin-like protein